MHTVLLFYVLTCKIYDIFIAFNWLNIFNPIKIFFCRFSSTNLSNDWYWIKSNFIPLKLIWLNAAKVSAYISVILISQSSVFAKALKRVFKKIYEMTFKREIDGLPIFWSCLTRVDYYKLTDRWIHIRSLDIIKYEHDFST